MKKKKFFYACLMLILIACVCAYTQEEEQVDRATVSFSNPGQPGFLKASVLNGSITVKGYDGKEAIAEMMRAGEGYVFRLRDREIVDIDVSGDLAYTVNSYYYTWHAEGAEPQWHKTKNVHIWRKGEDGQWKLHVDIWNSDVPMSQFSEE